MIFYAPVASSAYRKLLNHLVHNSTPHSVRGLEMWSEIIGATIIVERAGTNELELPGRNFKAYSYCEALWDMCPTGSVALLRAFNKNIDRFVNDQPEEFRDEAVWAYGKTVSIELPRCVEELRKDPYSRRAVITMPRNLLTIGTHPCLVSIQFFIRRLSEDCLPRLHAVVNMRSNDAWLGFPIDIFQFGLMQHVVAAALKLPVGSYIHHAASLHLYERDIVAARRLLETPISGPEYASIPPLPPDAYLELEGKLLCELELVGWGVNPDPNSHFIRYLSYLQEQWFVKNGQ